MPHFIYSAACSAFNVMFSLFQSIMYKYRKLLRKIVNTRDDKILSYSENAALVIFLRDISIHHIS